MLLRAHAQSATWRHSTRSPELAQAIAAADALARFFVFDNGARIERTRAQAAHDWTAGP